MSENPSANDREVRSFLWARDPSVDRRCRPCPEKRKCLTYTDIKEEDCNDEHTATTEETIDDQYSKTTSDASTSQVVENGAMVYLRFRPVEAPSSVYQISEAGNVLITGPLNPLNITCKNKNIIEKHYSFSAIFDSAIDQKDIYKSCVEQKISVEDSFTVLTYGTSGSGKTFTLLGDGARPGIIPRALEQIFKMHGANIYPVPILKIDKANAIIVDDNQSSKEMDVRNRLLHACPDIKDEYKRLQAIIYNDHGFEIRQTEGLSVQVWISFVELYNEHVYDLLTPPSRIGGHAVPRKNLKIIGNDGKVFIKDVTSVFIKNSTEAYQLLQYGLERVTYASTAINENSSRSHCIFFVNIIKYYSSAEIQQCSYKFCDLAGSERVVKTGNVGNRLKEAQSINTSLMVLGRCLDAATASKKRPKDIIPYRDSKLTMLLQSSLLGKEQLAMVVNVLPIDKYYEENLNVLGFASKAKEIIYKQPVVKHNSSRYSFFMNKDTERNQYLEQLLEGNIFLQNENERLNREMEDLKYRHSLELFEQERKLRNELVDSFQMVLLDKKKLYEKLQQEMEEQERLYEAKIAAMKRQHEMDIEELRAEWDEEKENSKDGNTKKSRRTLQ